MARVASDNTSRNKDHWKKAIEGDVSEKDWKEFIRLEGMSAGVDFPISIFYKELMEIYPNAKVLFTDRDPEKWYESVKNSIMKMAPFFSGGFSNLPLRPLVGKMPNIP